MGQQANNMEKFMGHLSGLAPGSLQGRICHSMPPATPPVTQLWHPRHQSWGHGEVAGGLEWETSLLEAAGNQHGQVTKEFS